jgi:alpha-beta hydrolase superfamily lysophospholipase
MIEPEAHVSPRPTDVGPLAGDDQHVASSARLTALDGVSLHYRRWLPLDEGPLASLLFMHGIASHGAWFAETAAHLANRGIAVYAPDRRGSGLSDGPRGHLDSFEQALGDLESLLDLIAQQHPAIPIFLAGSSWAAKLAIAGAARFERRLAGLILHGPGFFPRDDLSLVEKLAVLIHHRPRPRHAVRIPLAPEQYTRNPVYLEYIRSDTSRLLTASASFFWETRRLDRARDSLASALTLPILLQIGQVDAIMDVAATCRWVRRLNAPDRTLIVYPNASHTLDFESAPTVRAYRADLLGWQRRQLARNAETRRAGDVP